MENLNLIELKADELNEVEGGLVFWATVGAGLLIAAGAAVMTEIMSDWEHFKDGVKAAM